MDEIWKDSFTYPEYLMVSSLGRIKRKPYEYLKINRSKLGKEFLHNTIVRECILKSTQQRTCYTTVTTTVNGKKIRISVHKEVALTFLGEPESNSFVVDHIDRDRANNIVSNLRWVSRAENSDNSDYVRGLGKCSTRFTGKIEAYDITTNELVAELSGNIDMKSKGFDYRLVSAVLMGKRRSHKGCYFIKTDTGVTVAEKQVDSFSKNNFVPIDFIDETGILVFTINSYDELIDKGFIPLNVSNVLIGKAKTHKGYTIKLHNLGEQHDSI